LPPSSTGRVPAEGLHTGQQGDPPLERPRTSGHSSAAPTVQSSASGSRSDFRMTDYGRSIPYVPPTADEFHPTTTGASDRPPGIARAPAGAGRAPPPSDLGGSGSATFPSPSAARLLLASSWCRAAVAGMR